HQRLFLPETSEKQYVLNSEKFLLVEASHKFLDKFPVSWNLVSLFIINQIPGNRKFIEKFMTCFNQKEFF
ncbi:MAG: hypothetical protein QNJ37_04980, partial [Crocosphaera sp.]|nr:hypothetical protein [Crocosphaera sp.]